MAMRKARIGVLTGGGDCAGLNPAIKWVVKTAMDERLEWERGIRYEVVGIRDGWKGLTDVDPATWDTAGHLVQLNPDVAYLGPVRRHLPGVVPLQPLCPGK
jgi:6-phosphofructokinase